MKVIQNKFIPFGYYTYIMILVLIFTKKDPKLISERTMRHEEIHKAQMFEMLIVGFYLWYLLAWIIRQFDFDLTDDDYMESYLEQEAYEHDDDEDYLELRRPFAWLKYINDGK